MTMANLRLVHFLLALAPLAACADSDKPDRTERTDQASPDDENDEDDGEDDGENDGDDAPANSSDAGKTETNTADAGKTRDAGRPPSMGGPSTEDRDAGPSVPSKLDAGATTPLDGGSTGGGRDAGGGSTSDSGATTRTDSGAGPVANPGADRTVNETIVVKAGETFDGKGGRFRAGSALGDGSQAEGQKPIFKVEDGAKLVNVVLGAPAADGVHTYGDVTLENIVWEDIGEDAMTIKESGEVILRGGSATNGDDKVFQINAASTFRVSDFKASNAGKFIRQNGDTTFKVEVFIDNCDISQMDEAIFRTDSSTSTVSMSNTRYSEIGDALFVGVGAANIKQMNNTEY
jgi:pectate lyase C